MEVKRGRGKPKKIIEDAIIEKTDVSVKQDEPSLNNQLHENFKKEVVAEEIKETETVSQADQDYSPLTSEPVINRGYGTTQIPPSSQPIPEIPEPRFIPPPSDQLNSEPKKPIIPSNPELENVSDKDKRKASEALVDGVFQIWAWLKSLAAKRASIDMEKVKKLHSAAKIDMHMAITMPNGRSFTFMDIAQDFNNQVAESFIVTETFKAQVREPMIREFIKRNIGLTDIQSILMYFGIDAATTIYNMMDLHKKANEIIESHQKPIISTKTTTTTTSDTPTKEQPKGEEPAKDVTEPASSEYKEVGEK